MSTINLYNQVCKDKRLIKFLNLTKEKNIKNISQKIIVNYIHKKLDPSAMEFINNEKNKKILINQEPKTAGIYLGNLIFHCYKSYELDKEFEEKNITPNMKSVLPKIVSYYYDSIPLKDMNDGYVIYNAVVDKFAADILKIMRLNVEETFEKNEIDIKIIIEKILGVIDYLNSLFEYENTNLDSNERPTKRQRKD